MKVGVLLSETSPAAGGGFTFEHEVFDALVRLGGESRHRFCVFTSAPPAEPVDAPHLEFVHLPPRRAITPRAALAVRECAALATRAGRRRRSRRRGSGIKTSWREPLLLEAGVDVMWYPTPEVETVEIPFITVVWDLQHRLQPFFPEVSGDGAWAFRERTYATTLRRAARVVVGTEAGRDEVERFYQVPHERISILPHPTPEFAFAPPAGDEQATLDRLDVPQPYVFYPAQFWPHKNHANLLAAVRLLRDEYDLRIGLVLVGSDKGNRAYVDQLIDRWNLADQVCLPGFVSQDELLTLYRNALALTYVTHFGPENLPPLEAFAAGCPVIASNVSGSSEQLADAVVPVDPCQPQEIATAIHRLHTDPDLRTQLITRGRERSTRFRAPDFVRGVFAMLDELEPLRQTWPGSDQLWP